MFDWDTSVRQSVKISIDDKSDDVASIAFSVDPEMLKKLDIPARVDQRSTLDYDKMYRFQLERDLVKIVGKYGHFRDRDARNVKARRADPEFAPFLEKNAGMEGNTSEIAVATATASWQATSQPFGPIAEKHHLARIKKKEKTLSETQTLEIRQRVQDENLWDSIRFGYLEEKRVVKVTAVQREEQKREQKRLADEKHEAELLAKDPWKYYITKNQFSSLRKRLTKFDVLDNMKDWDKGHHPEHDIETGFPKVAFVEHNLARINISQDSIMKADIFGANDLKKSIPELYIPSDGIVGRKFKEARVSQSYVEAQALVNRTREERKAAIIRAKKEELFKDRSSARRGHISKEQLRLDALHAMIANKLKEEALIPDNDDDDDTNSLSTSAEIEARAQARRDLEAEWKREAGLDRTNINAHDQNDGKSVRFANETAGEDVASNSIGDGTSLSFKSEDSFVTQWPSPGKPAPQTKNKSFSSRIRERFAEMVEEIREDGVKAYASSLKERVTMGLSVLVDPASKLLATITSSKKRVSPYEVDDTAYHEAVAAELSIDDSVSRLQAQVDQMEADELAFNKFSFKGISEDTSGNRKRKLAKLRRRLEAKKELAEELRRAAAEAEANKKRDEAMAKALKEMEAVQERMKLVNQLTEAIKSAHRGAKQAAVAITGSIALEKNDEVAHSFLNEKMSAEKLKRGAKLMSALCRIRDKQREQKTKFRDRLDFLLGPYEGFGPRPNVNDLIFAIQAGDVNGVIDQIDTSTDPVHPNQMNQDGNCGMFAMLYMLLYNEKAQAKFTSLTTIETPFQATMGKLKRLIFGKDKDVVNLSVVLQLLLYKGGNLNVVTGESDGVGWGIAHLAAEEGASEYLEWFCSVGGNPNLPSLGKKYTPLMCAARKDQMDAALILLKLGAMDTLEAKDCDGWTAMHHASAFGSAQFVQVLLLVGAKHNVRNTAGYSPTDEAESRRRNATVELLRTFTVKSSEHMERIKFFQEMYKDKLGVDAFEMYMSNEQDKRDIKKVQLTFGPQDNEEYYSENEDDDDDD